MNDTNICKTCNWFDGLACRNNQEICIDNSAYLDQTVVIHNICAEESDRIRKDNTIRALKDLFTLYHNSNYVSQRISDEYTRIEGYTRHSFYEIKDAMDVIRSRYGYYCAISYTYNPCDMFLLITVKEREYGHRKEADYE